MLGKTNQIFKKLVYAGIVASVLLTGAAGKALSAPDSNSIVVDDIEFYVETDKSFYYLGENVQMLYRLTKLGFPSATIPCNRSPELNLVVRKDGETIWMKYTIWYWYSPGLKLLPGVPCEITADWDMNDANSFPVGPGTYDVLGVIYSGIGIPDVGVQITILPIPRTITVGLGAGYDFNTIQAAINDAYDGDTIIVADGTYTGDGNRDIDFLGKAITLRSENGPENCIINCNGTWTEHHRGFYFHSGEDANSIVDGFTITNGYATDGGGIKCCYSSSPIISNCIIMRNSVDDNGGGIYCRDSSPMLNNCTFNENWNLTIYIDPPEDLIGCGGGMCNYENSSPILTNCTFSRNDLAIGGGGIVNGLGCNPMLTNCIFHDNWAELGGGILNYLGSPTLTNCTFSSNDADWGSGMLNLLSSPTLTNCILWDGGDEIQNYASTITITYSDVKGGSTGVYLDPNSTLNWGVGNIDADPCFADADNDDYHLNSQAGRWEPSSEKWVQDAVTSPCIDAGNPGCPLGEEPVPNGNRRNMGAFGGTAEASKSPINWRSIADLTNDWVVDSNDLKVFVDYWLNTGECIPGDLNRNESTNSADFALLANNWLRSSPGKSVFDFGVATKGPLYMASNIEPEHGNISIESDVYIVSENSNLALELLGNSHIAGDVFIVNPFGTVDIQGVDASIGGETGEAALNHVHTGVDPIAFPVPNPSYFEHYVVEDINLAETTFTNVRIPPNTNPSFSGGVTMYGVVFIETPNLVTFTGHVNITGIIVGDGDVTDDSGTNRIDFLGTVNSNPVTDLPAGFGELKDETGTFLMAPGFSLSFGGDFETINGAIAANGITFSGNAGGTIEGSVLNYADTKMELRGNNDLYFNRFADTEIPAGFE
ncbi:MAG: hypothetical protein OEW48_00605 [Phycisphaerae bacterium]|nr:hypothetical protein [Phycisphaerae bacterium]